jgi:hypothetical protein
MTTIPDLIPLHDTASPQANPQSNQWLDLAREFRRVMQKA